MQLISRSHATNCLSKHVAFEDAESGQEIDCHEIIQAVAVIFNVLPITIANEVVRHGRIRRWEQDDA